METITSDVLVIGAGMAGLAAARSLKDSNLHATLVDKGRGVGGRVATRRLGERDAPRGRWDHGAQFATFRSSRLLDQLKAWNTLPSLHPWHPAPDGHTRHISPEGINAFAKSLALGLDIQSGERIVRLNPSKAGWTATAESGRSFEAPNVILTLPAPQALDLFRDSELDPLGASELRNISYHRNLTLMVELEGPSGIEAPGFLQPNKGILQTVVDNQQKGISREHTVTAQAQPDFSLEWYDRDRATAASLMRAALSEIVASKITRAQIHGWKFAEAVTRHPAPFLDLGNGLFAAGDGFEAGDEEAPPTARARIESALLSGIAVAGKI